MKLQAVIVVSFQASSMAEAGDKLDDVLGTARRREDVDVESVELRTPVGAGPVSLPHVARAEPPPGRVPHPLPSRRG